MGIPSELQANTSIALGTSEVTPLELTSAYVPFANGGYKPDIHFIQRITTSAGKVLYEGSGGSAPRAKKAACNWPSAGKTGTSQNSRDAWFVGYTANLTTGVWFGNDDGSPMKKVTGGALPALAWHEFMVAAHKGVPVAQLPGGWSSASGGIVPPNPLDGISDEDPVASLPEPPAAVAPAQPAKVVRDIRPAADVQPAP